jgi:protein TonB
MKDRTLLLSALIAFFIHALILSLNLGITPPSLASAAASIEVTLVEPPQSSSVETPPAAKPVPAASIETMVEPEAEPIPELEPELFPEPMPEPEPEPVRQLEFQEETYEVEAVEEPHAVARPIETEMPANGPIGTITDEVAQDNQMEGMMTTLDRMPSYRYNPKPRYPHAARRRGQEGKLLLLVEVLPSGRVGKIEIEKSSGFELLDNAAIDTVKRWRFVPAKRGANPVRAWVKIPVEFNLRSEK